MYGDCLSLFYQIFQYLEMHNMLDADDETHIWCLHMVYLPMINQHLETWKASWVHHPLGTESNKSPMQLWIGGLHATQFGLAMLRNARDPVTEVNIVSLSKSIFFQVTLMCKLINIKLFPTTTATSSLLPLINYSKDKNSLTAIVEARYSSQDSYMYHRGAPRKQKKVKVYI